MLVSSSRHDIWPKVRRLAADVRRSVWPIHRKLCMSWVFYYASSRRIQSDYFSYLIMLDFLKAMARATR
jgi:hypothetical protein